MTDQVHFASPLTYPALKDEVCVRNLIKDGKNPTRIRRNPKPNPVEAEIDRQTIGDATDWLEYTIRGHPKDRHDELRAYFQEQLTIALANQCSA